MSPKRFYILLAVGFAILIIMTVAGYIKVFNEDPNPSLSEGEPELQLTTDNVRVLFPFIDDEIESPVRIQGQARGFWFFEAEFPVQVVDANGEVLGQISIMAEGDWMTEEFVAFEGILQFSEPTTDTGAIIFARHNASGLPEHDDEVVLPVRFVR